MFSSITAALRIHLNVGQNLIMNVSSAFVSMETASVESLPNRVIEQVGGAQIRMPANFTMTVPIKRSVSLRVSQERIKVRTHIVR